jgi:hypothetical protein
MAHGLELSGPQRGAAEAALLLHSRPAGRGETGSTASIPGQPIRSKTALARCPDQGPAIATRPWQVVSVFAQSQLAPTGLELARSSIHS